MSYPFVSIENSICRILEINFQVTRFLLYRQQGGFYCNLNGRKNLLDRQPYQKENHAQQLKLNRKRVTWD